MAIRKSKTLPNDISGDYWKIVTENYDRVTNRCVWCIALFKDQEASNSGKAHLGLTKSFSKILIPEEESDRTAVGYNYIKAKSATVVAFITGQPDKLFDPDLANGEDV